MIDCHYFIFSHIYLLTAMHHLTPVKIHIINGNNKKVNKIKYTKEKEKWTTI